MLAAFIALAALLPSLAQAKIFHQYESVITEVPAEGPAGPVLMPGLLQQANSMTVFSGELYLAERLEGAGIAGSYSRTDQFTPSASGEYEFVSQLPPQPEPNQWRFTGIAFGAAAGETEMYIGQSPYSPPGGPTGVNVFDTGPCGTLECASLQTLWTGAEAPSPPFAGVGSVAVNHHPGDWSSGDVFVSDGQNDFVKHNVVDIFEPQPGGEEKYVGQLSGVSGSIAVSGFNGDLIVGGKVFRPEEEAPKKGKYVFVRQLESPQGPVAGTVAVDDGNGEIYVGTQGAVYEFGPEGTFRGDITGVPKEGTPAGVKGQSEEVQFNDGSARPLSLAVDPGSHKVFVGVFASHPVSTTPNNVSVVDVFGPDVVVPDVVTEAPSNLALETDPETGATSWAIKPTGSVNPDEAGEATCAFVWGVSESFGQEAPCSAPVKEGNAPVRVHANLSGLQPDTTYYYRLQATNANGTNQGEASETYRFTTPGPGLRSSSVSAVTSESATFEATVAPHDAPVEAHDFQLPTKSPTSYYFQYSTQGTGVCVAEPGACTSVPSAPASVGSGTADVHVSQHLQGLSPSTTYHYRLVAAGEALPATKPGVLVPFYGPDRSFTTQGPGGPLVLPDGRAWELVSDKHGAKILPSGQAAVGGGIFTFLTDIPTEPSPPGAGPHGVQVLSTRRAPGEWSSLDIALSDNTPEGVQVNNRHEYRFFSEDFGFAVAESEGPFSIPEGLHRNAGGEWERLVEASPLPSEQTPYLRHNATCSSAPASCYEPLLNSEDVTSGNRYEGTGVEGAANIVGGTPDASHLFIKSSVQLTSTEAPQGGLYEWSAARPAAQRLSLVSVTPGGEPLPAALRALAADGSRIILGGCVLGACGDMYARDLVSGEVAQLNLKEDGSQPANHILGWVGASTDASRVVFTTNTPLTNDSEASGGLYVCELASAPLRCALTDLTPEPQPGQPGFGEHITPSATLGVSADGTRVYFVAHGVLAAGAKPGAPNLYVAHEQEGTWVTSFIAPVAGVDPERALSPDGRWLAFSTTTPLTGYDNRDAKTGLPDSEVYLYEAQAGRLVCASCNPSGARPIGGSEVPPPQFEGARPSSEISPGLPREATSRSLFDTGRLFFNSADALASQDTNGNTDVYEFELAGVGSCTPAGTTFDTATAGCLGLISPGVAHGKSVFLDAGGTGADAFFTTEAPLAPQDPDTAVDIYDAHECTSASPCAPPEAPQPPACLTAESCRPAPLAQPSIAGAPATATLTGPGNVHETKPKKKHPKKNHRRKHHKRSHKRAGNNRRAGR